MGERITITGALSYSGCYMAERALEAGYDVHTLTGHPERPHPLRERIEVSPMDFSDERALVGAMRGSRVLINTFWVRFNRGRQTYGWAVESSRKLFAAAQAAGVERVVHVSITHPHADSPLPYFSGKAQVEQALVESGLGYAILRPTVLFGGRDILINNIAWMLRRLPVFGVPGSGAYGIQPVHVEDLAVLAITQAGHSHDVVMDAVGPETYRYIELVKAIGRTIGCERPVLRLPPWLAWLAGRGLGLIQGDVTITRDEVKGLMDNLLVSDGAPTCPTHLSEWAHAHREQLGRDYASEVERHY